MIDADPYLAERRRMIDTQIVARGVRDPRVLAAMLAVPRHEFAGKAAAHLAYTDRPLAIGHGQTISQPYIVAWMTELLALETDHRVLEIGTGCGYQTAVLARIAAHVFSVERVPELSETAARNLQSIGNVSLRVGDGFQGWPEHAPYDRVIVTAAPPYIPPVLTDQLVSGGRLVLPVGGRARQRMTVVDKDADGGLKVSEHGAVMFVPMLPTS